MLELDLVFFSDEDFFPAYVFLGAVSVFLAAAGLAESLAVCIDLAAGLAVFTVLVEDALAGAVLEDGALRPAEDLAVVALVVAGLDFDPGFVAGFAAVFVVGAVFEVFEVGLF